MTAVRSVSKTNVGRFEILRNNYFPTKHTAQRKENIVVVKRNQGKTTPHCRISTIQSVTITFRFLLFSPLKRSLKGQSFASDVKGIQAVHYFFAYHPQEYYEQGI